MAASVIIAEKIGATGSINDKTSGTIRMKGADNATVDSEDGLEIPSSGQTFSFTKWLILKITDTKPNDKINNIKFYSDGSGGFGTGISTWAKSHAAFSTPSEPTTSSGYVDLFGLTSAAPLALSSADFSGSGTEIGSHVVLLMEISATATIGALTAETITFSYDEL